MTLTLEVMMKNIDIKQNSTQCTTHPTPYQTSKGKTFFTITNPKIFLCQIISSLCAIDFQEPPKISTRCSKVLPFNDSSFFENRNNFLEVSDGYFLKVSFFLMITL